MEPKHVLITGANKGIGLATVRAMLEREGASRVFLGSRSAARGQAARAQLVEESAEWASRITVVELDVADSDSVLTAGRQVKADLKGGALYGIINNAGIGLGAHSMSDVLNVNSRGPHRVCKTFVPLLQPDAGRVVNVSSASGPSFVARCAPARQKFLTNPSVTWDEVAQFMDECLQLEASGGDFSSAGLGDGDAYGISKACVNAYTIALAREFSGLTINACTPGFIETDLTRGYAKRAGKSIAAMGMKQPVDGTRASLHLLLGSPGGSGWFFGSDAQRSPLDRYRSPSDPPFTGS